DYFIHWAKNEGNEGLLNHIFDEGIDLSKAAIEFQTSEIFVHANIRANHRGETTLNGLYAAGDEVFATISHAAVFGRSAGENAVRYAEKLRRPDTSPLLPEIEEKKAFFEEIMSREEGAPWQEAIAALQQVMQDYCGAIRSEALLAAGLNTLRRLKIKAHASLVAANAHELMHCQQTLNLMDIGELVLLGALDRKETREWHVRSDYAYTDPTLSDKLHVVRQVKGQPELSWVTAQVGVV
ncbi:FAD-dependent oxidoreductase, partial [Chloroflexota bacterium]